VSVESKGRALSEVVLDQLSTTESRAYKMWLPPLTDPTAVDELVARADGQRLYFPLGIMDEPRRHLQEPWGVDVSGGAATSASEVRRRPASQRCCRP